MTRAWTQSKEIGILPPMRVKRQTWKSPRREILIFVGLVVLLLFLADYFVFGNNPSAPIPPPPVRVQPANGAAYFESHPLEQHEIEAPDQAAAQPQAEEPVDVPPQVIAPSAPSLAPAVPPEAKIKFEKKTEFVLPEMKSRPRIAIIIDDLGMNVPRTKDVIDLPAPLTLAFLPYAPEVRKLAAAGRAKGHELIIHVPMEAMNGTLNIGPMGLHTGMSPSDFEAQFDKILQSFEGYDGINNHMGSRLTQDIPAMTHLMTLLKRHGLFFVDSKTIGTSMAEKAARQAGIPYAGRDVFLDHVETQAFAAAALVKAEQVARKNGYAIAIGHPKDFTIRALKDWIPTLAAKGIDLVPVREVLKRPAVAVPVPEAGKSISLEKPKTVSASWPAVPETQPHPLPQ